MLLLIISSTPAERITNLQDRFSDIWRRVANGSVALHRIISTHALTSADIFETCIYNILVFCLGMLGLINLICLLSGNCFH